MKPDRPTYLVVLRPEPGLPERDQYRHLRAILKRLLRSHGFRCIKAERLPPMGRTPPTLEEESRQGAR